MHPTWLPVGENMTKVDISPMVNIFHDFFTSIYHEDLNKLLSNYPSKKSLEVDYLDLERFDPELADKLIKDPDNVLEAAQEALKNMNLTVATGKKFEPNVRFQNMATNETVIESIGSKSINEMVYFRGVLTRRAEVMHRAKEAVYRCQLCEAEIRVPVDKNFNPPKKCDSCKKLALVQDEDQSTFTDIQRGEIQELLERVRGGAPASRVELYMEDDLVNKISPGDNVEIVGILRLRPPMKPKSKQELIFGRYVEVNSIRSMKRDFEEIEITKEDEQRIEELSKKPNIREIVRDSIAPFIYGHNEVKSAIVLQLFGGRTGKTLQGDAPVRDDIHILLIGDPGIAKCTDGNSKIVFPDGSVRTIREIVEERIREERIPVDDGFYSTGNDSTLSFDLRGRLGRNNASCFWKLRAPEYMYEVETATGKKLKVTPTHPFFISDNGYISAKAARDLTEGEHIATPSFLPINGAIQKIPTISEGNTDVDKARIPGEVNGGFARLLGYIAGAGHLRKTPSCEIGFTSNDDTLINDFSEIIKSYDLKHAIGSDRPGTISVFSADLERVIEWTDILGTSSEGTVPDLIMRSPDKIVGEFLKAYFDCKASINDAKITVLSTSKSMLEMIGILLLRFGIVSYLHPAPLNAENFEISISGENAIRYAEKISSISKYKKKRLSSLDKNSDTNIDVVPNIGSILKETKDCLGISQSDCRIPRMTYQHLEKGNGNLSRISFRNILAEFKKYLPYPPFNDERLEKAERNIALLETLSSSHIFWDRIKSIKRTETNDKWVYDLQVDSVHNFIANGIMVHNSRFLQSISEIAPKSIYVSGKSVSSAGLCVGGDSLVTLNDRGILEIGDYIDANFTQSNEEIKHAFSSPYDSKVLSADNRMKANYGKSGKIWKIRPPEYLFNLSTEKGKHLRLTPNTSLIVLRNGIPEWKRPPELRKNDLIATSQKVKPLKGKGISILSMIDNPDIKITNESFKRIIGKLAKEHDYHCADERLHKEQSVKQDILKRMCENAGSSLSGMKIDIALEGCGRIHRIPALLNPDVCYLAGLIAGNGDAHKNEDGNPAVVEFRTDDKGLAEKAGGIIRDNFDLESRVRQDEKGLSNILVDSIILAEIMKQLVIPQKGKHDLADIPPYLTSAGEECVRAYLKGIFDTGGEICTGEGNDRSFSVRFGARNRRFALKILLLLEWWGIAGMIMEREGQYHIEIKGFEDLKRFECAIGFMTRDKGSKLEKHIKQEKDKSNDEPDSAYILPLLKEMGGNMDIGNAFREKNISHEKLKEIMRRLPESKEKELLEILCNSDIYWDRVKEIRKEEPGEKWVYDFTVDDRHNFFANGIVVHNTVAAEKDELGEGGWTLKAGALVLASGGMAQVDEFDKIEDEDRSALHEVMETQQISVAKAGIVAKFKTKAAILAAANPKYGRFDQTKSLSEQFDIPPTLLSRFDLIFPIVDILDEEKDSKLAKHILSTHMANDEVTAEEKELLDKDILRKYISYSRRNCFPRLTNSASERIREFYVDLRGKSKEAGSVAITPRYLEGLVRLAEASAKVNLRNIVEAEDAQVAIDLFNYVMKKIMTDRETGAFDVDVVTTGRTKTDREKMQRSDTILEVIREHLREKDTADIEEVIQDSENYGIDDKAARKIINELLRKGEIYEKEHGHVRIVGER